jgi:threonylcarbamoyladenosine tRNA methylthiotransferase MtaB
MNRNYSAAQFRGVVADLVASMPDLCLGADVIVGFPGETDDEFEATASLLEELPFSYLHVFPFSPRAGTPAAAMPGHLNPSIIKGRAEILRRLSARKKREYLNRFVGHELPVLMQTEEADGMVRGLSRNYLAVQCEGSPALLRREVMVRITGVVRDELRGVLTAV